MSPQARPGDRTIRIRRVIGIRLLLRLLVANAVALIAVASVLNQSAFLEGVLVQNILANAVGLPVALAVVILTSTAVVGLSFVPEYLRAYHPWWHRLLYRRTGSRQGDSYPDSPADDTDRSFLDGLFGGDDGDGGGGDDGE